MGRHKQFLSGYLKSFKKIIKQFLIIALCLHCNDQ